MSTKSLEERFQIMEAVEAIKKLKFDYAEGCDVAVNKGNTEPFLRVFTEDAVWDGGDFGRYSGKGELEEFIGGIREQLIYSIHYFTNPRIEVEGNKARGHWYLLALFTETTGRDLMLVASENDKYEKVDGKWLKAEMELKIDYYGPFLEGWHEATMAKYGKQK